MDIKKILKEEIPNEEIEHYQKILKRKEEIKNTLPEPKMTEKLLLSFEPTIGEIPIKEVWNKKEGGESWMKFLKDDEVKEIVKLNPSDELYQRIRQRCYIRKYYSDPENLKLQYKRNKKQWEKKRIEKKEGLKESLSSILEERKKEIDARREMNKERSRERYHRIKNDPTFKEKEKENNKKYREEHKNYRKINHILRKGGSIPLSPKGLLRKETIKTKLIEYKTSIEFKNDQPKDYQWIRNNGVTDELLGHFPDYIKRKKYKSEKEDAKDEVTSKMRKAKRNASKCYSLREFKRRFPASYEYCTEMKIEAEIISLFKIVLE